MISSTNYQIERATLSATVTPKPTTTFVQQTAAIQFVTETLQVYSGRPGYKRGSTVALGTKCRSGEPVDVLEGLLNTTSSGDCYLHDSNTADLRTIPIKYGVDTVITCKIPEVFILATNCSTSPIFKKLQELKCLGQYGNANPNDIEVWHWCCGNRIGS